MAWNPSLLDKREQGVDFNYVLFSPQSFPVSINIFQGVEACEVKTQEKYDSMMLATTNISPTVNGTFLSRWWFSGWDPFGKIEW